MRELLARFGWLRVASVAVLLLPFLVLPALGIVWLWDASLVAGWLGVLAIAAALAFILNRFAISRERRRLEEATTGAGENWPAEAERCWDKVEAFAGSASTAQWPLNDGPGMMRLAREVLLLVAQHFHPRAKQPLLAMTVPHTLTIIERAAGELRDTLVQNIPMSHRVTLGTMVQAKELHAFFKQHEGLYRMLRAVVSPQGAVLGELRRMVMNQAFAHGSEQVQTWLLREYIRKLGYHAIELYGGLSRLDVSGPLDAPDPRLLEDSEEAASAEARQAEPLRILILGRANAGKSSLINALFGELKAAHDLLPDTTIGIVPYRLEREGRMQALVFDTPGLDGDAFDARALERAARDADLVLWVTAADRADRAAERQWLDSLREAWSDPLRRPPPMLVVMTHIDRLRPPREWQPPYVLDPPEGVKAEQIVAALEAVTRELGVEAGQVIPVCLAEGKVYNVEDALWAAMLRTQPQADRVRLLRCLHARRRAENWDLLWRQLGNAGRVLSRLPRRGDRPSVNRP
jgi:uncharacterized protein